MNEKNVYVLKKLEDEERLISSALRCLETRVQYKPFLITSPKDTIDYLRLQIAMEENEVFSVLFLDNLHRVIKFEKLFFGTINYTMIYPRVVVQKALAHNAAAVIFAHNHPSGSIEPSWGDKEMTKTLQSALQLIDVKVLDHMVVSCESSFSFAEAGLL